MIQATEGPREPYRAARRAASAYWVALLLATYAWLCAAVWAQARWRPEWDSAIYLLTARSLATGGGYAYLDQPFFLRPPGFSWLLSLWPRGELDFASLNRMVMLCAGACVAAVHFALKPMVGRGLALAVALLSGTCPLFTRNFNWVLSEFPFAILLFTAIGLFERARTGGIRVWMLHLAGALCLALAVYVRTTGLLLLPGLLVAGALRRNRQALAAAATAAVLVAIACAPWLQFARDAARGADVPSEQLLLHDYTTALFHVDPGDPGSPYVSLAGWLKRLGENSRHLCAEFARAVLALEHPAAGWLLALAVFAGFLRATLRRPSLLEWFAASYTALLLGYFTYAERLVMPLAPLLYAYVLEPIAILSKGWARRRHEARTSSVLPILAVLLFICVNLAFLPRHLDADRWPAGSATQGDRWRDVETTADWIRENTPTDAVVLCNRAPTLSLLSGRRAYTYRFLRGGDPLRKYAVDFAVFDGPAPAHLEGFVQSRSDPVASLEGTEKRIAIYRVRPD